MSNFASIDAHTSQLHIVNNGEIDGRREHVVVAFLGTVASRRAATARLAEAGYVTAGAWRTDTDGDAIRSLVSNITEQANRRAR